MAVKHLHELLQEEQEPFKLQSFIAQRRSQFNTPTTKSTLLFEKQRPTSRKLTSQRILCKRACFFSFQNSPDVTHSPFYEIQRPTAAMKIPTENSTSLRPMKQQLKKPNSQLEPNERFGVFGLILKKLSGKKRCRSREFRHNVSLHPAPENSVTVERKSSLGKTTLFETLERDYDDMDFLVQSATLGGENGHLSPCDLHFCSSPFSPFRFSLHSSPSSGSRTPIFTSPATSPGGPTKQENCEVGSEEKIAVEAAQDEKEQCSPVSVLDPPFADDDEGRREDSDDDDDDDYNPEYSYETLQRSKNQLLLKLQRFEKLAELDPTELERWLSEDQEDDNDSESVEEDSESSSERNVKCLITEVLSNSGHHLRKASYDTRKLVSDLLSDEERHGDDDDANELVVTRVCHRLDSWREVKSTTIEIMVERDLVKEFDQCESNDQGVIMGEIAMEIANDIFGMLVDEFLEKFIVLSGVWRRESVLDFIEAIPFSF